MIVRTATSLFALMLAAPLAASPGPARGFQLPPAPTPTPTPQAQGPEDVRNGVRVPPRTIPTETPTPTPAATAPAPTPTPVPTGAAPPTPSSQTPPPAPVRQTGPSPVPSAPPTFPAQAPDQSPTAAADTASTASDLPLLPTAEPPVSAAVTDPTDPTGQPWLVWILTAIGILLAGIAGLWWLRQRELASANVPTIEPPLARKPAENPTPTPAPAPAAGTAPPAEQKPVRSSPIHMGIDVRNLSRSMRFATLAARIEVTNASEGALSAIALEADLTTAHGSIPMREQLAGPETQLEPLGRIESLKTGQTGELVKQIRLPLEQVRPIRQGAATLYVPLLRLRVSAEGIGATTHTFVIGTRPAVPGGKLQPFRLDETPQTYHAIGALPLE